MAAKIQLEIATPERLLLSAGVDEVVLPSLEGYMGVQSGHGLDDDCNQIENHADSCQLCQHKRNCAVCPDRRAKSFFKKFIGGDCVVFT